MIKGERVVLRAVRDSDLKILFDLQSDMALRGEFLRSPLPSEVAFQKEFHETGFLTKEKGLLLITDLDRRIIGAIGYFPAGYLDGLELGAQIFDPALRRSGVMTEALNLAIRYLFDSYKVNRLQWVTLPLNEAAKRTATKCGFTFEGRLRGARFYRGRSEDLLLYSLIKSDLDG